MYVYMCSLSVVVARQMYMDIMAMSAVVVTLPSKVESMTLACNTIGIVLG